MINVFNHALIYRNIFISLMILMLMNTAFAFNASDTIQMQITGIITASSCQVVVAEEVDLGTTSRQDISVPGGNSGMVPVIVQLNQCSPQLSQAHISFSGTPYKEDATFASAIYANEQADGAKDLGLQLINLDGKTQVNLANGVNYTFPLDTTTHNGRFVIGARMYTPHGAPTAGLFKSAVTVSFTYQ
ncbi:fimbrial protein [Enterobacter roggenkampii]|uniref:fimbrial protein n=1 Tax=Enterobacter roggenkampii TaxID=1812935 RepID=UPI0012380C8B|nr:fimbrial protein [Enterobacter roggenkampii]